MAEACLRDASGNGVQCVDGGLRRIQHAKQGKKGTTCRYPTMTDVRAVG